MNACDVIKAYIDDNGIKQVHVAKKAGIPPELLRRSLDGKRKLPADEFIAICGALSLDLQNFKAQSVTAAR